jgi:hypothetical protein
MSKRTWDELIDDVIVCVFIVAVVMAFGVLIHAASV